MPTEIVTRSDDELQKIRCEKQTGTDAAPTCTVSYGRALAAGIGCLTEERPASTKVYTFINSHPGRLTYSSGVETVLETIEYLSLPTGTPYSWCGEGEFQGYPSDFSGIVSTISTLSATDAATYQVIITAGQEKLPSKTSSSQQPSSTGAAVPLRTAAPAYIGLGAALAAFVL
jgi:hypothetical protein